MIDVAHDGHHRRPRLQRVRIVGDIEQPFFDVRFGDALDAVAQFLGDQLGSVGVDGVGDLEHLPLLHQDRDDRARRLGHAVGQLLDRDRLRNRDLADELLLAVAGDFLLAPLDAASEGGVGALALFVGRKRCHHGETPAPLVGGRAGRFRGNDWTRGGAAATRTPRLFLLGLLRTGSGGKRPGQLRLDLFLAADGETLGGLLLGAALDLFVVTAAILFLFLAGFCGVALGSFDRVARLADGGLFFGDLAFLGLAQPGIGEGAAARLLLLLGERGRTGPAGFGDSAPRARLGTGARATTVGRAVAVRLAGAATTGAASGLPLPAMRLFTFSTTTCLVRPWLKF